MSYELPHRFSVFVKLIVWHHSAIAENVANNFLVRDRVTARNMSMSYWTMQLNKLRVSCCYSQCWCLHNLQSTAQQHAGCKGRVTYLARILFLETMQQLPDWNGLFTTSTYHLLIFFSVLHVTMSWIIYFNFTIPSY